MRKGLTQALMAVAVVMMAAQAMSMAPIIGNIPSPVVGDNENVTPANTFVFPDAIDLTAYVTDKNADGSDNPPANIMWSYEILGGTARYRINNRDQIAGTDDPSNPPAAKRIDGPGSADEDPLGTNDADSKITIRNIALTPITEPPSPGTDPGAAGIIPAETQEVTFYAGDGTTFSFKNVLFYTDNDGNDRLSGGGVSGTPVYTQTFTGTVANWGYRTLGGNITSSYDNTIGALCINTQAAGDNLAVWSGPWGTVLPLVNNAVYDIRYKVNSSQATQGQVPFWDMLVNDYGYENPAGQQNLKGLNLYGGNYMFLDNTGGANAVTTAKSPMEFRMVWCPSPVVTAQWNDTTSPPFPNGPGPWAPGEDGNNDGFVEFRILDAASAVGVNGAAANGTLCLNEVNITRFDVTQVQVVANRLNFATITQGGLNGANGVGNTRATTIVGATASFAGGAVTIDPAGGPMLSQVEPGDYVFDLGTNNSVLDNYPVAMTPNTLYRIQFVLSAPTQADADAPMDIMWVGADTPTNECINLSYVTVNAWHHGMPKTAQSTYTAFFFSNQGTAATNPAHFNQFRWRMMFGNADTLGGGEPNTGAIRLHSVVVDEVTL